MTLNNVLLLLIIIFILYLTFTTLYCNYVSVKEGLFETKKSEVREISETSIGSGITHYNGETFLPLKEYQDILDNLINACANYEHDLIRDILLSTPTDFNPSNGIGDLVWNEQVNA